MREPYVKVSSTNATDEPDQRYDYYYGAKENANYTFTMSGDPFQWDVAAYLVK